MEKLVKQDVQWCIHLASKGKVCYMKGPQEKYSNTAVKGVGSGSHTRGLPSLGSPDSRKWDLGHNLRSSLGLSFFTYKMGIRIPSSQGTVRGE